MRLACLLAVSCLLSSCNATGLIDDTVPQIIRDSARTFGEESVRDDLHTFATSDQVEDILRRLVRDLLETVTGSARGPEVEASLRALIATAIDELRHDTTDLPPAMGTALDDLMRDAEAMVGRVVSRSLRELRGMVRGDDVSRWVRDLLQGVLTDLWALASHGLDDESAHHLGHWMHTLFGEVLADVELEAGTQRMAHAAARGFGDGLAESLDGELGDVLHAERDEFVTALREGSADAARPWIIASCVALFAAIVLFALWIRTHRAHEMTIQALQGGAERGEAAATVLKTARKRGISLGKERDEPSLKQ